MAIELELLTAGLDIPEDERTWTLPDKERIIIGSDPAECDFTVRGSGMVSGRHCEINYYKKINLYTVRDLGSKNGTFVNGRKIKDETVLMNGNELGLARAIKYR